MNIKKNRLILCNNFYLNQYYNLYINNKTILNNKLNQKNTNLLIISINNINLLKYTIIKKHNIFINNNKNILNINNLYLKKYYTFITLNNYNITNNYNKCINKANYFFSF